MSIRNIAMQCAQLLALAALGLGAYWSAFRLASPEVPFASCPWSAVAFVPLVFMGSEYFRLPAYSLDRNLLRRLTISAAVAIPSLLIASVAAGPVEKSADSAARDIRLLFVGTVVYAYLAFVARRLLDSQTGLPGPTDNASNGN